MFLNGRNTNCPIFAEQKLSSYFCFIKTFLKMFLKSRKNFLAKVQASFLHQLTFWSLLLSPIIIMILLSKCQINFLTTSSMQVDVWHKKEIKTKFYQVKHEVYVYRKSSSSVYFPLYHNYLTPDWLVLDKILERGASREISST